MVIKIILACVLFLSATAQSSDNTFFGITVSSNLAEFKSKNSKLIKECKELGRFSSLRLNSEITGIYEHNENETNVTQVECKMTNDLSAAFVKVDSHFLLWSINKYNLDKSVAKVVSDLEAKTRNLIKIKTEEVNESMGKQFSFKVSFLDGEIRGSAVEPYSKSMTPETLTMKNAGLKIVFPKPLQLIIKKNTEIKNEREKTDKESINSGQSGI